MVSQILLICEIETNSLLIHIYIDITLSHLNLNNNAFFEINYMPNYSSIQKKTDIMMKKCYFYCKE